MLTSMLASTLFALTALTPTADAGGETHWFDEPILFIDAEELLAFDEPILFMDVTGGFDNPIVGYSDREAITIAGEFDSFGIKDAASWRQDNTEFCRDGQYDVAPPVVIEADLAAVVDDPRAVRELSSFVDPLIALDMSGVMSGREAFGLPLVGLELGDAHPKELAAVWEGAPLVQIAVIDDRETFTNPLVAIGSQGDLWELSAEDLVDLDLGFIEIIVDR